MKEKSRTNKIELSGLLIGGITFYGYLSTYIFLWGYYVYYGIPSDFIEISLQSIFSLTSLLAIAPLYFMVIIYMYNKRKFQSMIKQNEIAWLSTLIIIVSFMTSILSKVGNIILASIPPIIYIIILISFKSYKSKHYTEDKDRYVKHKTTYIPYIVTVLVLLVCCFFSGNAQAIANEKYKILSNYKDMVAVGIFHDNFLAFEFNEKRKEIYTDKLILVPLSEASISYIQIGRLKTITYSK